MAPRKIQTYDSKFSRFNEVKKAGVISKRRNKISSRHNDVPIRFARLLEESLEVSLEDTFDKLKRGPIYNVIDFKDRNNIASFSKSNSMSNKDNSSINKIDIETSSKFTHVDANSDASSVFHQKLHENSTSSHDHLGSLETESLKKNRSEPDSFVMPHKKGKLSQETSFDISSGPIGNTTKNSFKPFSYSTPVSFIVDKILQDKLKSNDSKNLVGSTPPRNFVTKRRRVFLYNKIESYSHNSQEKSDSSIHQHHHPEDKPQTFTRKAQKQVSDNTESKTLDSEYDHCESKDLLSEHAPSVSGTENTSEMECENSHSEKNRSKTSIKTDDNSASKDLFSENVPSVTGIENTSEIECGNDILGKTESKTSNKTDVDLEYDNTASKDLFSEYAPPVSVTENTSEMECGRSYSDNAESKISIKTDADLEYDNSASKDLISENAPSISVAKSISEVERGRSISQNHNSSEIQSDNSIRTSPKVGYDGDVLEQASECAQPETSMTTVTSSISGTVHLNPGPSSAQPMGPNESIIIDLTDDVDDSKPTTFRLPCRMSKPGKSWRRWLHKDTPEEEIANFKRRSRRSSLKIVPLVPHQPIKTEVPGELGTIWESFSNISLDAPEEETPENPLTARDSVLLKCGQKEPESFESIYNERTLINCTKIGEGTFGEVFGFQISAEETCVMKVMPIEGDQLVNGEEQKKFCEVLSEISIAMALSNLRENTRNCTDSFNELYRVRCLQGVYPQVLVKQWEIFDQEKCSENDHPSMFQRDQLYIVLELRNGGTSLEDYQFQNSKQSYHMFQQIAFALAVAENAVKFEHRDLHWGNILLAKENLKVETKFELNGTKCSFPSGGVRATIIDFTLSRVEFEQMVIFNDLAKDDELFKGDAKVDYQFDIYRLMKDKNGNDWQKFEPYTNLLWLHYLLDKVIRSVKYLRNRSSVHKTFMNKLKALETDILAYDSVTNFVMSKFIGMACVFLPEFLRPCQVTCTEVNFIKFTTSSGVGTSNNKTGQPWTNSKNSW